MARESKQKRDGRRFGKPRRFADMILNALPEDWSMAPWIGRGMRDSAIKGAGEFIDDLAGCPVISAGNVSDYFYEHPQQSWGVENFPCCLPPFDRFFVEMKRPEKALLKDGFESRPSWCPDFFGVMFRYIPVPGQSRDEEDFNGRTLLCDLPGAKWLFIAELIAKWGDRIVYPGVISWRFASETGQVFSEGQNLVMASDQGDENLSDVDAQTACFFLPAMLAVSFMNCKNVTTKSQLPDHQVNRERRKAGLKPFIRYHTINIEPMKSVLKSEGGIEENGLKKALHICRGHFATYSDKMFGRSLDKPVTVWRPAHVRGSSKEGIVVSDYRVNAPSGGAR